MSKSTRRRELRLARYNSQPQRISTCPLQALPHGASVRVKTCDLTGRVASYTLRTDHHYWRGYEVRCEPGAGACFDRWTMRSFAEAH